MRKKERYLTPTLINTYVKFLKEEERSAATIEKYVRDLTTLQCFLGDRPLTKDALIDWKQRLTETHAPSSVNSMLAALNSFLAFINRQELRMRPLKIQKALFLDEKKELTRAEYVRLVKAAERQENERLSLVLQTICATGIRVSELRFITVEAVGMGRAEIVNKGKRRVVFLPEKLRLPAGNANP